jgi:hypothetical protein
MLIPDSDRKETMDSKTLKDAPSVSKPVPRTAAVETGLRSLKSVLVPAVD